MVRSPWVMLPSWSLETMRPISRPYFTARRCAEEERGGEEEEGAAVASSAVALRGGVVFSSSFFCSPSSSSSAAIDFKTSFKDFPSTRSMNIDDDRLSTNKIVGAWTPKILAFISDRHSANNRLLVNFWSKTGCLYFFLNRCFTTHGFPRNVVENTRASAPCERR